MKIILPVGLLKLWPSVGQVKQVLSICNSTEAQGAWWSSALDENPLTLFSPQLAVDQCVLSLDEPAQYNLINRINFFTELKTFTFLEPIII